MVLQTQHLARCLATLECSLELLRRSSPGGTEHEVFRNATVKGFELTLETSAKLLRKALRRFVAVPRSVDELPWKDVFRLGARHGLLQPDEVERWFRYRDNRNSTAHDYGEGFAEETLALLPGFVEDARRLEAALRAGASDAGA